MTALKGTVSRRSGCRSQTGDVIDHFLLSPDLADQLGQAGVDRQVRRWEKASDHAPVWIKLKE